MLYKVNNKKIGHFSLTPIISTKITTGREKNKTNTGKPTLIFSNKTHTKDQATQPVELVDPSIIH